MISELGSDIRDRQIIEKKIAYNEKQIKKLEDNNGNIALIHKCKENIELYRKQLEL